jgi:hypothetical protein
MPLLRNNLGFKFYLLLSFLLLLKNHITKEQFLLEFFALSDGIWETLKGGSLTTPTIYFRSFQLTTNKNNKYQKSSSCAGIFSG